jgi:hypothetical protein
MKSRAGARPSGLPAAADEDSQKVLLAVKNMGGEDRRDVACRS